ncbi:MAG: hypothetical protein IID45_16090, partial [Planctomycetes bacterium]|nr:hypothetical protein [Planctomycetota bacterium]
IRPELDNLKPEPGKHIVVYNHYDTADSGRAALLISWAQSRGIPVRAYGFPHVPRGQNGRVTFRPAGREALLDDMRTARAVMTSAGLTAPLEGFLLQKPVGVVPIPGHWEQHVNAFHLSQAGIALGLEEWDYDRLLEIPTPNADHPLNGWLRTPADRVLAHILDEKAGPSSRTTTLDSDSHVDQFAA